jgi:hypothetical protein
MIKFTLINHKGISLLVILFNKSVVGPLFITLPKSTSTPNLITTYLILLNKFSP